MTPRRGRPTVATDRRRAKRVTVAMTAGEVARLRHVAAASGAPTSVTLRRIAIDWIEQHPDSGAPTPADLARAVSAQSVQLARIGSNLNQIARGMNRGRMRNFLRPSDDKIATALLDTRAAIDQMTATLIDLLESRR